MSSLQLILFAASLFAGLVCLVLFLKSRVKAATPGAALWKTATSVFFIIAALIGTLCAGRPDDFRFGALVLTGLVLGMIGDITLDLKYVYPLDGRIWTYAGFISFMIGHFFFIGSMFYKFREEKIGTLYIIIPLIISLVVAVCVVAGEKLLKLKYGEFKAITGLYGFVLVSTTTFAGSFSILTHFNNVPVIMFCAGVFFLISDLILSGTYFGEGKNRPVDIVTNHVTYYIAQYLFAVAVLVSSSNFYA